jgi:hypothetical protein
MPIDKRAARREFKERQTAKGIFAVRCTASNQVWVGASGDLESARTGAWFLLRNGMHHNKPLQDAWNTHGPQTFQYERLEQFEAGLSPMSLNDLQRDRRKHWLQELSAAAF